MAETESILSRLRYMSDSSEFVNFFPEGYEIGRTKYIIVSGGVMSTVGKGVFAGSLAHLLTLRGYTVAPVKLEGYLNVDSGTLNPFRHGEVFVLADGAETDLDLGNYERFIDQDLTGDHFITAGKVYWSVLKKEREGGYSGRDVLVIPHLTGEIKFLLRKLAVKKHFDFVIVEIGGTIGDYENVFFVEAVRQLRYDEGRENVIFCHVTPVLYSDASSELKSKPTQHSVRTLQGLGIQPDMIVARSKYPYTTRIIEKISVYCNVPVDQVFKSPNVDSIYHLPSILEKQNIIEKIVELVRLEPKPKPARLPLESYRQDTSGDEITVAIVGKYVANADAYLSILMALEHVAVKLGMHLKVELVNSEDVAEDFQILGSLKPNAIIIPGGFGSRGVDGKIKAARYAREQRVPTLGLCLGFQVGLIEIARNLCGWTNANSTEFDPKTEHPIIYLLPNQRSLELLVGGTMRLGAHQVRIVKGTRTHTLYGGSRVTERFRHRYEFNQAYKCILEEQGVVFSGTTPDGSIMQIFELRNQPYYIGTQFHPEYQSRPRKPHPLFLGLLEEARKHRMHQV